MTDGSKRKKRRYRINQIFEKINQQKFYADIISDKGQTRVQIADLSSTGFGYEIVLGGFIGMDIQDNMDVQIQIFYPGNTISAGAKLIWNFILEDEEIEILKGGMMFTAISPVEKQKLSSLIESFGKNSI